MKYLILLLIACNANFKLFAQKHAEANITSNPIWIQMMDDSNVNYYEAVNAFNIYWEDKVKPVEENELFVVSNEMKSDKNFVAQKKRAEASEANQYRFEYKKFKHWQQRVIPFVKLDGHLMTTTERLAVWKLQQQNRH